jgi:murein L,D-transpeptidase YcbB/YkuD
MRKFAIALLATTMLGSPAAFAASNNQQPSQSKQMQHSQNQMGAQSGQQNQPAQNSQQQQGQQNGQQQAAQNTQSVSPKNLSKGEIRQVQQALDQDGFKAGRSDGRWGRETASAVKQFQQSKQLNASGQLDRQTIADLGLDTSQFFPSQTQQK